MLEQPTARTAAGPAAPGLQATRESTSRMHVRTSAQLPAGSKDCEPGMPSAGGCDHSRWARPASEPSRQNRAARQLPVPASRASR
jgi:hypothetical protein